jgi:hypothetical protein
MLLSTGVLGTDIVVCEELPFPVNRPKSPPAAFNPGTGIIGVLPVLPFMMDDAAEEVPLLGVGKPEPLELAAVDDKLTADGFRDTMGV